MVKGYFWDLDIFGGVEEILEVQEEIPVYEKYGLSAQISNVQCYMRF